MDTIAIAAAAVTGARHVRVGRNGQDAAATWDTVGAAGQPIAVAVVCDGCSSGAWSEVGARLGARVFARALGERLARGHAVAARATWEDARCEVRAVLVRLVDELGGARETAIHDHLLFTIVAAAATPTEAAVWALGDGGYAFDGVTHVLGPFADNQPPYLAYDLLGDPQPAHFAIAPSTCTSIVIGTDGASELADGLARFDRPASVAHPDALRRQLALLARTPERIDWDERRIVRAPAALQDDGAVAVLRRRAP